VQRPPFWVGLFLLGLLLGLVRASGWPRARAGPAPGGGAAAFLLETERDPRRMSARELRTLPGVGEGLAQELAAFRAARAGQAFAWEDVAGIGAERARRLRAWAEARGLSGEPFGAGEERYAAAMESKTLPALLAWAALVAAGCSGEPERVDAAPVEPRGPERATLSLGEFEVSVVSTRVASPDAVVLLHGARYSAADWLASGTLAFLEERGVRALALDWPGSGESPAGAREPEAAELLTALFHAADVQRAVLVGPSRGGAQALSLAQQGHPRVVGLFLIAPAGAATFQPGPRLGARTLLLWGADDDSVPLSAGEALAARLQGARLEVLAGRGHACHFEDSARFHALLADFLAELGFLAR
jgi:abhydrolase domain-containing protein 14